MLAVLFLKSSINSYIFLSGSQGELALISSSHYVRGKQVANPSQGQTAKNKLITIHAVDTFHTDFFLQTKACTNLFSAADVTSYSFQNQVQFRSVTDLVVYKL